MGVYPKGNPEHSAPEFLVLRTLDLNKGDLDGGVPATTLLESYKAPCKMLIRGVRVKVKTAGTAASHGFLLKQNSTAAVGGTLVATVTCGTLAANGWADGTLTSTAADLIVEKDQYLTLNTVASSACDTSRVEIAWQRVYDSAE